MLGEVALYSFVVILLTGTFLTFFFQASMAPVDLQRSRSCRSRASRCHRPWTRRLKISFEVRGGLLVRQIHHWAALLFIASIGLHMLRIFFTGAFRKPRELNWTIGFLLFILALAEGFTGYSLPDDLLSGNGLRIIDGMVKGIPFVGTWISYLIFGGEFPGEQIVGRLYTLHILAVACHIGGHDRAAPGVRRGAQAHAVRRAPAKRTRMSSVTRFCRYTRLRPAGSSSSCSVSSRSSRRSSQINPIWNYGPYDPSPVSAGTQPDWYIGFADGALRLIPPGLESVIWGHTYSWNILIPIVVLGLFISIVALYPLVEGWITADKREHHILDRPRNAPTRTALGAAGVTFYAGLWAAASSDLIATHFELSIEAVIHTIQALVILGPIIAYFVAKRVCLALQKKDREIALHGFESGRIVRLPGGEYIEVHQQVDEYERWRLVTFNEYKPLMIRPNAKGKITQTERLRARMSHWFFEDRIAPVTRTELERQSHDHH